MVGTGTKDKADRTMLEEKEQGQDQGQSPDPRHGSGVQQGHENARGFAAMDPDQQRAIASKGGRASPGNFANDPARAAAAGRKGGQMSPGNFANDPARAAVAGRKGGGVASGGRSNHRGPDAEQRGIAPDGPTNER